jgi:type I restriction enzyme, S subunit
MSVMTPTPLRKLADLQAGVGFPLDLQGRDFGDYPLAKVGDISRAARSGQTMLCAADHYVNEGDLLRLRAKPIPPGSILFSKIGEAIRQNHRVIAGRPLLIDNNAMAAIPNSRVESKFLYHFLRTVDFYPLASATTVPALRKSELEKLLVPLPALPEQRRIAELLDNADALLAKRRAALAKLDALTESIFLDMFGDPATNPKGWPEVPLGSHALKIGSGATPLGGESAYKSSGIALIRSMNVRNGFFSRNGLAFIDEQQAGRLDGVIVEADDVLLNITGASVARVCRAPRDALPARVNQHVAILRPTRTFEPRFLEQCLLYPSMKRRLLQVAGAGATREAITKDAIERLAIIQPPRSTQDSFATLVRQRERMESSHRNQQIAAKALFSSLQYRAFQGEL